MNSSEIADSDLDALAAELYPELRRIARRVMRRERGDHTLQSTAVVHEAYVRLAQGERRVESRAHFLATAARVMRQVLIDHARGRNRLKRAGGRQRISLTEADREGRDGLFEVLAVDRALLELQRFDERRARLIELQLFGGLDYAEMGAVLGISKATVHRELRLARAWLQRELSADGSGREESP